MSKGIAETFRMIRRSPYQALAAIFVLWLTFLVAYVLSYALFASDRVLSYFETRPQVVAFFKPSVEQTKINEIAKQFSQKSNVSKVKVVTKDEALATYRKENAKDPMLLDLVTADVLPASMEVSATAPEELEKIREEFATYSDFIEEVVFQKDFVDTLTGWTAGIRLGGLIAVAVLVVTSVIIMTVLVSMKVAIKRKELGILRLLGASEGYIFSPFLLEGMFYGFLGSGFAWLTAFTALLYATPSIIRFMGDIPVLPVPTQFYAVQAGAGIFSGIFLGLCASLIALRRIARQ